MRPRSKPPCPKPRATLKAWPGPCSACAPKACWPTCRPTPRARLSGTLIGAELAAARPYWLGRPVALIGAAKLADVYTAALRLQGLDPARADVAEMTRRGLSAARTPATPTPTLH